MTNYIKPKRKRRRRRKKKKKRESKFTDPEWRNKQALLSAVAPSGGYT